MANQLPTAIEMKELVRTPSNADTVLRLAILNALYTAAAAASGETSIVTGSISVGSADEDNIRCIYGQLHQAGFKITPVSDGVFTLTFQR